ncbi:MAG: alpha/beta hydrolase family protein [Pyrinomonadaceae bacterium]
MKTNRRASYDPFARGPFPVGVRTIQARDEARGRTYPCEIWYPATSNHAGQDLASTQDSFAFQIPDTNRKQMAIRDAAAEAGTYPLIAFSHSSGGNRRSATFLCTHLSSHGYVVAALDHSEIVAPELARNSNETNDEKTVRQQAWIANRVPDIRFLLDQLVARALWNSQAYVDAERIGIVGHSFGGWTALATPDAEPRIRSVVTLAPGGSSHPKPGILNVKLGFNWGRDVPTLYLVAENDISLPLEGMYELFGRTPATKRMVILRRADHMHFMDNVEEVHESLRNMQFTAELAWISREMRPIAELCSGEESHLFARGLTLCHMDAVLRQNADARRFLNGDLESELAMRGVAALVHNPDR